MKRASSDAMVAYISKMVTEALRDTDELMAERISAEVVEPCTPVPVDIPAISLTVRKTGRVVIIVEDCISRANRGGTEGSVLRRRS